MLTKSATGRFDTEMITRQVTSETPTPANSARCRE